MQRPEHGRSDGDTDSEPEPHLIVFKARLPFALPLRPERLHVFKLARRYAQPEDEEVYGQPMVRLRLVHVELPPGHGSPVFRPGMIQGLQALDGETSPEDVPHEPPALHPEVQSWAEMATPFAALEDEDANYLDTECFERCLEQLNHLIRGFALAVGSPLVRPINKESLDPMLMIDREVADGSRFGGNIFMLHSNFSGGHDFELVSDQDEERVFDGMKLIADAHPFTRHREWLERAKDARFRRGDYEEALICLQISIECLFNGLVRATAADEGLTAKEVQERVVAWTSPFAALVGTHLPSLLGGHWSTSDAGAVGTYWRNLYFRRNAMTHGGARATSSQVGAAFDAFDDLIDFIIGQLLKAPSRFPRTIFALLGEPGLRRRGSWTRRMRDFADQIGDEPYPYWAAWDVAGRPDPHAT